jgi:hypothetical protein
MKALRFNQQTMATSIMEFTIVNMQSEMISFKRQFSKEMLSSTQQLWILGGSDCI